MKKSLAIGSLCVIFICLISGLGGVFAITNEQIQFIFKDKIFTYNLSENIVNSSQFDLNYKINKYKRFSSKEDRIKLLKQMKNAGFENRVVIEYLFPNIENTIENIESTISIKPKNAKLKINTNTENVFFYESEIVGLKLNKEKLYQNIVSAYLKDKALIFALPTYKIVPQVVKSDLKKYTNLRSDFSTDISRSSSDRKHNIKTALSALNKIEIAPNEIFSFNKIVGKRTPENGYRTAKIIINNEFVEGVGGGVCQVSTTLYNSALLAGLEILEANKHSKQVSYIKPGFDAMVNFGSSDLKFRNNTQEKLTLVTNCTNNKARIRIFGDKKNSEFRLTNEIVSVTEPTETILVDEKQEFTDKVVYDDEYFYLKKPSTGMEIKSYREEYLHGELKSKQLLRFDKFKVQDAVKVYGAKKRNENTMFSTLFG